MAFRTGVSAQIHNNTSLVSGGITTVAGDLAVLFIQTFQGVTTSVLDSNSNAWAGIVGSPFGFASNKGYLWIYTSLLTTVGASNTFTVNTTGTSDIVLCAAMFSGRALPLDGYATWAVDSSFGTGHTGSTITTLIGGSDLVSCVAENASGTTGTETFTPATNFTSGVEWDGDGTIQSPMMVQYQNNVAANTYTVGCTTSASHKDGFVTLALQPAFVSSIPWVT